MLVSRVDRFARSTLHLLHAHDALRQAWMTLRSMTEPFDTATPLGEFIMMLLGGPGRCSGPPSSRGSNWGACGRNPEAEVLRLFRQRRQAQAREVEAVTQELADPTRRIAARKAGQDAVITLYR